MKATTLASLLVASTAVGAAAGSPFFFAVTTPVAFLERTWAPTATGVELVYPVQSQPMVITDISATGGGFGEFVLTVNGAPLWVWNMMTSGYSGVRDGRIELQHGIPVPAGAQVKIEQTSSGFLPAIAIGGYCYD